MQEGSYDLADLTWEEVREVLGREPRLLLGVGALEQHGPHLPLGANTLVADRLTADVSREVGILRAPTLPYGVAMSASDEYAGSTTLRRKTFHRAVNELLAGWEDDGVEEFVLVTAHRYEPHLDALLMALTSESETTVIDLYQVDVSDIVESSPALEHAGELETSLLLHLAPERVRMGQLRDAVREDASPPGRYTRGGMPTPPEGSRGRVGRVDLASAEKGERIYTRYRAALRVALAREGADDGS